MPGAAPVPSCCPDRMCIVPRHAGGTRAIGSSWRQRSHGSCCDASSGALSSAVLPTLSPSILRGCSRKPLNALRGCAADASAAHGPRGARATCDVACMADAGPTAAAGAPPPLPGLAPPLPPAAAGAPPADAAAEAAAAAADADAAAQPPPPVPDDGAGPASTSEAPLPPAEAEEEDPLIVAQREREAAEKAKEAAPEIPPYDEDALKVGPGTAPAWMAAGRAGRSGCGAVQAGAGMTRGSRWVPSCDCLRLLAGARPTHPFLSPSPRPPGVLHGPEGRGAGGRGQPHPQRLQAQPV